MQAILTGLSYLPLIWAACSQNTFNMQQCSTKHDEWLWPEIQRGWNLATGVEQAYYTEAAEPRELGALKTFENESHTKKVDPWAPY